MNELKELAWWRSHAVTVCYQGDTVAADHITPEMIAADSGAIPCTVSSYDLSIPGWMDENELQWLYETAKQMASVVEIGCYQGRSTFALLQGCPGPVFAVDTWVDIMGTGADNFALFCGQIFSRLPKTTWSCGRHEPKSSSAATITTMQNGRTLPRWWIGSSGRG